MENNNSIFRPDFFPEEVASLYLSAHAIEGVEHASQEMRDYDEVTAKHLAGTALIAAAILVEINEIEPVDYELAKQVVAAAELHDIGQMHPDLQDLVGFVGKYSKEQNEKKHLHTTYGAELLNHYPAMRQNTLITDIVYLHHSTKDEIETYISERDFEDSYAQKLRFGVMIVSIADVVEATMPIGAENSHASYGDREAPLGEISKKVYEPHAESLPDVNAKPTALNAATMYARLRVAEHQLAQRKVA